MERKCPQDAICTNQINPELCLVLVRYSREVRGYSLEKISVNHPNTNLIDIIINIRNSVFKSIKGIVNIIQCLLNFIFNIF